MVAKVFENSNFSYFLGMKSEINQYEQLAQGLSFTHVEMQNDRTIDLHFMEESFKKTKKLQ